MVQICSLPILVMACKPSMVSKAEQPEKLMVISLSCAMPLLGEGGGVAWGGGSGDRPWYGKLHGGKKLA
eukprot:4368839-Heterocapsa_arctica.AAC.1